MQSLTNIALVRKRMSEDLTCLCNDQRSKGIAHGNPVKVSLKSMARQTIEIRSYYGENAHGYNDLVSQYQSQLSEWHKAAANTRVLHILYTQGVIRSLLFCRLVPLSDYPSIKSDTMTPLYRICLIVTLPEARGNGYASQLLRHAARLTHLIARVNSLGALWSNAGMHISPNPDYYTTI